MSLVTQIQTAFQGIQLILVFITVLFSLRYNQIQDSINKRIPKEINRKDEREKIKKELKQKFWIYCLPLLIINGFAFYLFLPLFCEIIKGINNFKVDYIWNFDFSIACFLFITLMIGGFFVWTIILSIKLILHIYSKK